MLNMKFSDTWVTHRDLGGAVWININGLNAEGIKEEGLWKL